MEMPTCNQAPSSTVSCVLRTWKNWGTPLGEALTHPRTQWTQGTTPNWTGPPTSRRCWASTRVRISRQGNGRCDRLVSVRLLVLFIWQMTTIRPPVLCFDMMFLSSLHLQHVQIDIVPCQEAMRLYLMLHADHEGGQLDRVCFASPIQMAWIPSLWWVLFLYS